MPNYVILGVKKIKGGSIAASDSHCSRTRETLNADTEKLHLNELLVGEDRPLREMIEERISEQGIWRRSNSVEAVELLTGASRAHFLNHEGEIDMEKVIEWRRADVQWLKSEFGDNLLKAGSHADEHSPHNWAYVLPVVNGRLNARALVGDRQDLSRLLDRYAKAMEPLGLERGVQGSKAKHQDIKRFYGTIMKPVEITVDRSRIPLPAMRDIVMSRGREAYRNQVVESVLAKVEEQVQTIRNQSLLTLEETRKRENAEDKVAVLTAKIKQANEEKKTALEKEQAERNKLLRQNLELKNKLSEQSAQYLHLMKQAYKLRDRLSDIPLKEVMERLGYQGSRQKDETVYRLRDGQTRIAITNENAVYDQEDRLICENSIGLVQLMERANNKVQCTERQALDWLMRAFGEQRAAAAYMHKTEQSIAPLFVEMRQERADREQQQNEQRALEIANRSRQEPALEPVRNYSRSSFDR